MEPIRTVGDLREKLKYSEDEEPLVFDFKDDGKWVELVCAGVGSSGGGRITVLWLDRKHKPPGLTYHI